MQCARISRHDVRLCILQQGLCCARNNESWNPAFSPLERPRREISGQQYRPVAPGWCRGSSILGVGPRHAPEIRVDQTEHCAHLCSVRDCVSLRRGGSRESEKRAKETRGDRPTAWHYYFAPRETLSLSCPLVPAVFRGALASWTSFDVTVVNFILRCFWECVSKRQNKTFQ